MRPARMKTPAAAPTAAPLASPVTFSVSSALASAISSRTSSEAFSVTSVIALPSSDVCVVRHSSVDQPLEDAGEQERAAKATRRATSGRSSGLGSAAASAGGPRMRPPPRRPPPGRCPIPGPGTSRSRPRGSRSALADLRVSRRQPLGVGGLLARPARPRPRRARRASLALRSLRESFSSCFSAASASSCALAVSSSARRASVSRSCWRSSAPRASASARSAWACGLAGRGGRLGLLRGRARGGLSLLVRACRGSDRLVFEAAGSTPAVRWGSSSLTRADLPQRCGGIPRPRCGWSRSRPGPRCRRAGRTRPGA